MNGRAGLPAALAPIAEVLALAGSFALCIVTGPRDHRDSVYLRITASLADDLEFVRHRLDRDGLEFFDVLTGGDGVRPRVIFMSGLERMSDEARRDATRRLNLLRDSWAPHPARVILWLPAWGLGEFRKLAPDLFHWRSCLVALHDADLPIRTETEYLVWACERHGGAREVTPVSPREVQQIHHITDEHRVAYVGWSGQERVLLLRTATRYLARTRLEMSAGCQPDLDILAAGTNEVTPDARPSVPLLFQTADMAGRLALEPGWLSYGRAAGIPLADSATDFLSRLGERGELTVLLDAIDRLDLSPGSPAHRLLAWLDHENPAIRVVAFIVDSAPPELDAWTRVDFNESPYWHISRTLQEGPDLRDAVKRLLRDLFATPRDNYLLADHLFGPEVADEVPSWSTFDESAERLTQILEQRGLLDASFFDQLKELRPAYAAAIDAVARTYLGPPAP